MGRSATAILHQYQRQLWQIDEAGITVGVTQQQQQQKPETAQWV
jgi:hypothetical protein